MHTIRVLSEEARWAWLAALVDGEGSVMLNRRTYSPRMRAGLPDAAVSRPHYRAVMSIANTDERLFHALDERFPGLGQRYRHVAGGGVSAPRKRAQWTWRWNATTLRAHGPTLLPFLVLKQGQLALVLEALDIKDRYLTPTLGWRADSSSVSLARERLDALYDEIRQMNTRGRVPLEQGEEVVPR